MAIIHRDRALKEAAQCRAVITGVLAAAETTLTLSKMFERAQPELPKGYIQKRLEVCLRGMVNNKLVDRMGKPGHYEYLHPGRVDSLQAEKKQRKTSKERLDIVVGKRGDYAEITLRGLTIRITVGE